MQERIEDHEKRLKKLERQTEPIKRIDAMEDKLERFEHDMKHLKSTLDHVKLDTGTARESLDSIGRQELETHILLRHLIEKQPDYSERFDTLKIELRQELETISNTWLDTLQEHYTEHTDRFDRIEKQLTAMDKKLDDKFTTIINLLQQRKGD